MNQTDVTYVVPGTMLKMLFEQMNGFIPETKRPGFEAFYKGGNAFTHLILKSLHVSFNIIIAFTNMDSRTLKYNLYKPVSIFEFSMNEIVVLNTFAMIFNIINTTAVDSITDGQVTVVTEDPRKLLEFYESKPQMPDFLNMEVLVPGPKYSIERLNLLINSFIDGKIEIYAMKLTDLVEEFAMLRGLNKGRKVAKIEVTERTFKDKNEGSDKLRRKEDRTTKSMLFRQKKVTEGRKEGRPEDMELELIEDKDYFNINMAENAVNFLFLQASTGQYIKPNSKADAINLIKSDVDTLSPMILDDPANNDLQLQSKMMIVQSLNRRIKDLKNTWRIAIKSGNTTYAKTIKTQAQDLANNRKGLLKEIVQLRLAKSISMAYRRESERAQFDGVSPHTEEWVDSEKITFQPNFRLRNKVDRMRRRRAYGETFKFDEKLL